MIKFILLFISFPCFATYIPFSTSSGGSLQAVEYVASAGDASNCPLSAKSSDWVASGSGGGAGGGSCTFTLKSGYFATQPFCVCVATSTGQSCEVDATSTSSVQATIIATTTGSGQDGAMRVMCMGTRAK